ncbi:MAG: hypothetical protein WCV85_05105 [Patescibacteria group bacterium]|jgi:hypothetical protein
MGGRKVIAGGGLCAFYQIKPFRDMDWNIIANFFIISITGVLGYLLLWRSHVKKKETQETLATLLIGGSIIWQYGSTGLTLGVIYVTAFWLIGSLHNKKLTYFWKSAASENVDGRAISTYYHGWITIFGLAIPCFWLFMGLIYKLFS